MPYDSDLLSLWQALDSRFRACASDHPGRNVPDLQRQFAYDRLLARVFSGPDAPRWVVLGSAAILARLSGVGRQAHDIDLFRVGDDDLDAAEVALRRAAEINLDDFFRFSLGAARAIAQPRRLPVEATLGAKIFARFRVDVLTGLSMTGEPDLVDPPLPEIPGVVRVQYRAFPLADHIAQKVCMLFELQPRAEKWIVQTLADIVTIARTSTSTIDAASIIIAVRSEESRRGLSYPQALVLPSGDGWERRYAALARDLPSFVDRNLDSATATARAMINPVLAGAATGTWDRELLSWH